MVLGVCARVRRGIKIGNLRLMRELLRELSPSERAAILGELLGAGDFADIGRQAKLLTLAETWLEERMRNAGGGYVAARTRMWLIFMLLRHGALKLREIFDLKVEDCDFTLGIVRVRRCGNWRDVPLPLSVARRMRLAWSQWDSRLGADYPFKCDASQLRRVMRECARACGLGNGELNGRWLRRQRANELAASGLHPDLLNFFLGKSKPELFETNKANEIIREHIQMVGAMKTSARNFFSGRITTLRASGILVEVTLETATGLKVVSIITETSRANLDLREGMEINALIKAPWVSVWPENERDAARAAIENCFAGTVEKIARDEFASEILVTLPQGNTVCALYAQGATPSSAISEGSAVHVCFSAFAVILTKD